MGVLTPKLPPSAPLKSGRMSFYNNGRNVMAKTNVRMFIAATEPLPANHCVHGPIAAFSRSLLVPVTP
jgi:hypothetical protein